MKCHIWGSNPESQDRKARGAQNDPTRALAVLCLFAMKTCGEQLVRWGANAGCILHVPSLLRRTPLRIGKSQSSGIAELDTINHNFLIDTPELGLPFALCSLSDDVPSVKRPATFSMGHVSIVKSRLGAYLT